MNMLFDIWIRDNGQVTYTPEQDLLFETIWNYAYDRIAFLVDEIESEEAASTKPPAIVIHLLQRPYAIQPHGYSDKLHDRICGCFNDRDAELMWKDVEEKIKSLWN